MNCSTRLLCLSATLVALAFGVRHADAAFGDLVDRLQPDGLDAGSRFGQGLAIDGTAVAIGAPFSAGESGVVYLYDLTSTSGPVEFALPGVPRPARFGGAVDLLDDQLLVGADYDTAVAYSPIDRGAAYLLNTQSGEVVGSFPVSAEEFVGRGIGVAVALDESEAYVGVRDTRTFPIDPGSFVIEGGAYIFDSSSLVPTGELRVETVSSVGRAIDARGGVVVAGGTDGNGSHGAFVFDEQGQPMELVADDIGSGQLTFNPFGFGHSVSTDDGLIVVGAPLDFRHGGSGSAYLFDAETRAQMAKITPPTGSKAGGFGNATRLSGNLLLVGAHKSFGGLRSEGAAFLYDVQTGLLLHTFKPDDAEERGFFGISVDLTPSYAVIAATGVDDNRGAVYVYDVSNPQLPGDFNGDRRIDNADLSLLIAHWGDSTDTLSEDWVGRPAEGATVDNSELSELLYAWGAGVDHDAVAVIPEPSALMLLATLTLTSAGSRRRLA